VIALVAALDRARGIGRGNALPWRLPDDLRRFKALTLGHPVLMGRRTAESLGRALPGRDNLVLTRSGRVPFEGMQAVASLDEALARAGARPLFVIGGGEVYALALPRANELVLTEIEADFHGDTSFPRWPRADFVEVTRERHQAAPPNDFAFSFVTYRRRR